MNKLQNPWQNTRDCLFSADGPGNYNLNMSLFYHVIGGEFYNIQRCSEIPLPSTEKQTTSVPPWVGFRQHHHDPGGDFPWGSGRDGWWGRGLRSGRGVFPLLGGGVSVEWRTKKAFERKETRSTGAFLGIPAQNAYIHFLSDDSKSKDFNRFSLYSVKPPKPEIVQSLRSPFRSKYVFCCRRFLVADR